MRSRRTLKIQRQYEKWKTGGKWEDEKVIRESERETTGIILSGKFNGEKKVNLSLNLFVLPNIIEMKW